MSTETTSKLPAHQVSKRSRAPPPPAKKQSFEENKNGSLSEQEKDVLKNNGSLEDAGADERQLTVVLPGDKPVKASVAKDTLILELLIMIASKNKLNPTGHMIAQPAVRPNDPPVQLKSSQKLSDVIGDTVYIIPKNQKQLFVHKKSVVYEPTLRITVISGKNHKMCLRVDPEKTLQALLPLICDERGVEPSNHTLRLVTHPQDPLDMSQTLEKAGVIEFLLVDLKGQPAGCEMDLIMPEQKKKRGSFFGRMTKKKKGYEFGGGAIPEAPPANVTSPTETEQRSRRNTSPSLVPPPDVSAQTSSSAQEQDDANSNTLKKRRPAPPPPPGKNLTGAASDDEKLDEESSLASSNTLRKRRAPAPPRPTSPPRRTQSLGANSAPEVPSSAPPPRPVSPPVRTSVVPVDEEARGDPEVHATEAQEVSSTAQDKPPRPPKPPRPASIIRGASLETLPPSTEPPEPVFVPPPPPDLPPSPSGTQEDVTKLIEEGRLDQSFDESLKDEEFGEDSPLAHTESISSSVTVTGIDASFEEAIAMGEAEIEDDQDEKEVATVSLRQDSSGLDVEVEGVTLETSVEEGVEYGVPEREEYGVPEGEEVKEEKEEEEDVFTEKDETPSEVVEEQVVLPATNSYVNSNNEHGDSTVVANIGVDASASRLRKLMHKTPVKVYAVYDEDTARPAAGHSIPVEGAVRRTRAKSDSSVREVPIRVKSGRSLSVLEKAKPLEGMKLSCVQGSIDLTESPTTDAPPTTSENAAPMRGAAMDQRVAIESTEASQSETTFVEDLQLERKTIASLDTNSSIPSSRSTDKDNKAKKELLSHMMKMSLDEDTKDTNDYPPHTQADDTHNMLEEKSVHALAFEVTREAAVDSQKSRRGDVEDEGEKVEQKTESPRTVEDEKKGSPEAGPRGILLEKEPGEPTKIEESPKTIDNGEKKERVNEQYILLQAQLAALQKQMGLPQHAGVMEMQMQQLQQQMMLQQQIINQMMMSSSQQPMVMSLGYPQPMMSPQQQMMLAPQQMMSPPQQMMSPQMISPQQPILSPQQQMMMMSPQQLLMTPPMMYSPGSIPQNTAQTNTYSQQVTPTATVQAQQTPISSTHELNGSNESPTKDLEMITSEVDTSAVESEPRPISPPLKADEVPVGHPTYHFARSRDVPNKETKASPPNTLRSPKQQQRPTFFKPVKPGDGGPESEENVVTEPQPETPLSVDADQNSTPEGGHTDEIVDANQNPTLEGGHTEDTVDANQNQTLEGSHAEVVYAAKTKGKNSSDGDTSSISAFAVSEAQPTETVPPKSPKSPKQKKSGFSLFKKKTPKYSYILSAQREFSRKSETEGQRTGSNPTKPDLKLESGKGNRGRAHTLDSYGPNKASAGLTFDPVRAELEREMAKNVHIPPNVTISTTEIAPSSRQPEIPLRTASKPKPTNAKTSIPVSSPKNVSTQDPGSPDKTPSSTAINSSPPTCTTPTNKTPVPSTTSPSSNATSSVRTTSPTVRRAPSPVASKPNEPPSTIDKPPNPQPSPTKAVSKDTPQATSKVISKTPELVSPDSAEENPIPPVRKAHSKANDVCKIEVTGSEDQPEKASKEGAPFPRRRAQINNIRSKEQEQAKIRADASVSQLRQIFGQGNQ